MGRAAWRTSLLPLLLPLISLVAAVALTSRWSVLDPIQASIVERWTPLAAMLGAAVTVVAGWPSDATRRRRSAVVAAAPSVVFVVMLAVALVAPGESHIRLGWVYLAFVAAFAAVALYRVWLSLPSLNGTSVPLALTRAQIDFRKSCDAGAPAACRALKKL